MKWKVLDENLEEYFNVWFANGKVHYQVGWFPEVFTARMKFLKFLEEKFEIEEYEYCFIKQYLTTKEYKLTTCWNNLINE